MYSIKVRRLNPDITPNPVHIRHNESDIVYTTKGGMFNAR